MDQQEIYREARKILGMIKDVPLSHFTVYEALWLFRHCMREVGGEGNIVANFSEEDFNELVTIAYKVVQRGGPTAVH